MENIPIAVHCGRPHSSFIVKDCCRAGATDGVDVYLDISKTLSDEIANSTGDFNISLLSS